jgi:hypothetical protein
LQTLTLVTDQHSIRFIRIRAPILKGHGEVMHLTTDSVLFDYASTGGHLLRKVTSAYVKESVQRSRESDVDGAIFIADTGRMAP